MLVPGNTDEVIIPCLGVPGIHTSTPGSSKYRHRGVCSLIHGINSSGNHCYIVWVTIHKTDKTKVQDVRDKSDEERGEKEVGHRDSSHLWDPHQETVV